MKRVAIVTANIGGIDEIFPPIKQFHEYELCYFTENTLPFPLPHLNNRMKGKYFKTQAHRFLDHDVFIWIDSSIEVISPNFIEICLANLEEHDVVITRHEQRKNVYEELEYIIGKMKAGDKYLLKRYAKEPFYKEYDHYKQSGLPKTIPLFNCFFFARHNNAQMNAMFDEWWNEILCYSNFDQTAFSYVSWKHNAKVNVIEANNKL